MTTNGSTLEKGRVVEVSDRFNYGAVFVSS